MPNTHGDFDLQARTEESRLKAYLRRRLRPGEDVEDYVQEVYARVLARPPVAEVASWQALFRRVAANLIIDKARRARARGSLPDVALELEDDIRDDQPSAEDALMARQRLEVVASALKEAAPVARAIFLLVRVEGLSHRAAAERMGVDVKVASRHVERVLALVSRRLAEAASS